MPRGRRGRMANGAGSQNASACRRLKLLALDVVIGLRAEPLRVRRAMTGSTVYPAMSLRRMKQGHACDLPVGLCGISQRGGPPDLSEHTGDKFREILLEKKRQGRL